jgi:hypothetical protein
MTAATDLLDLATLDEFAPAAANASIWTNNLAALREVDPALAAQLAQVLVPDHWRLALALDGGPTWRTERAGDPPLWLGGTAAPRTRALAFLAEFRAVDRSPALPTIAAGAEVAVLLDRLPGHLAVFVFETDWAALAAVLRIHDLASAISRRRCVLIAPGRELDGLREVLASEPGLLPPANLLVPFYVSEQRVDGLRALCEQVHAEVAARRAQAIAELSAAPRAGKPADPAAPRVAILSLAPNPAYAALARSLELEAVALGWPVLRCGLDTPQDGHALAHCGALATFQPEVTICVNHRQNLPIGELARTCVWVLEPIRAGHDSLLGDATLLAATPTVGATLREAAPGPGRVLDWFFAVDESPTTDPTSELTPPLLVADLPDDRPEACGIDQPTHKQLWAELRRRASAAWESGRASRAEPLLLSAERATGIDVRDPDHRARMIDAIGRALIPAAVLHGICSQLAADSVAFQIIGGGWDRLTQPPAPVRGASILELPRRGAELRPIAVVVVSCGDPLSPAVLRAAYLGWPLLLLDPGGKSLGWGLGNVLQPGVHFQPLADRAELRAALAEIARDPSAAEARARRSRAHLAARHTYRRRLEQLRDLLNLAEREA